MIPGPVPTEPVIEGAGRWVIRQRMHDCRLPRLGGRRRCRYVDGDIWRCGGCGQHWRYYDNWAGDGFSKVAAP